MGFFLLKQKHSNWYSSSFSTKRYLKNFGFSSTKNESASTKTKSPGTSSTNLILLRRAMESETGNICAFWAPSTPGKVCHDFLKRPDRKPSMDTKVIMRLLRTNLVTHMKGEGRTLGMEIPSETLVFRQAEIATGPVEINEIFNLLTRDKKHWSRMKIHGNSLL